MKGLFFWGGNGNASYKGYIGARVGVGAVIKGCGCNQGTGKLNKKGAFPLLILYP